MSQSDDAIQPAAPPDEKAQTPAENIPLPPIDAKPAPDISPVVARLAFLDGVLILLTLAFAFLLAATKITNTDIFLHLATGRLIAQGAFPFTDPFSFTARATWVNQSWLFDLLLYLYHSITGVGGEALTALKAAGLALAAWLMIRGGSRPEGRAWIPVGCTLLAVLALSPRALLNPSLASLLLLAWLLVILARHTPGSRGIWAAVPLCLVWANLDAWFLLGPALLLLYLAGQALQAAQASDDERAALRADLGTLAGVSLAALAACLVNPFHVWAFTALPPELVRWGAGAELALDNQFRGWHLSLLEPLYYRRGVGLSPAGLAVFPLALAGLVSFAVNFSATRWWRALAWVAFLALALVAARTVPFFAAVTAVIAALNFQEASERALGTQPFLLPTWRAWGVSGRVLTAFIAFSLCVVSLPGWLQATPNSRYRVAFGLEVDQGLKAAALRVAEWRHAEAMPPGQHWFNLSPEVVNYFAWYCPGERFFIDQRLALHTGQAAKDFRDVRRSLEGLERPDDGAGGLPPMAWRRVMKDNGVRFFVFHYYTLDQASSTLVRLYSNTAEWTPCFVQGRTAIFAWRPIGEKPPPLDARLTLDFAGRAFGPDAALAPATPPPPRERSWASLFLEGELPTPGETATAQQHLIRFESLGGLYRLHAQRILVGTLAGSLIGRGAALSPFPGQFPVMARAGVFATARLTHPMRALGASGGLPLLKYEQADAFALQAVEPGWANNLDGGPPSSLYLGVRAARASLAENPDDATAHLLLGELYGRIINRTRELRRTADALPQAQVIRQTQIAAALHTLLQLKPARHLRQRAHGILMRTLQAQEYFDQQVYHLGEFLRLARELGEVPGSDPGQLDKVMESISKDYQGAFKQLQTNKNLFEVQSGGKPVMERVRIALRNGLSEEAIRLLSGATPEELHQAQGTQGLQLLVNLLLGLGRLEEARHLLTPVAGKEDKFDRRAFGTHPLGMPAYELFVAQLAAGAGDYAAADKALEGLAATMRASPAPLRFLAAVVPEAANGVNPPEGPPRLVARAAGECVLAAAARVTNRPGDYLAQSPVALFPPFLPRIADPRAVPFALRQYASVVLEPEADCLTLRAWLALEHGRTADAARLANQALDLGGDRRQIGFRSAPLADLVLSLCQAKEVVTP